MVLVAGIVAKYHFPVGASGVEGGDNSACKGHPGGEAPAEPLSIGSAGDDVGTVDPAWSMRRPSQDSVALYPSNPVHLIVPKS